MTHRRDMQVSIFFFFLVWVEEGKTTRKKKNDEQLPFENVRHAIAIVDCKVGSKVTTVL